MGRLVFDMVPFAAGKFRYFASIVLHIADCRSCFDNINRHWDVFRNRYHAMREKSRALLLNINYLPVINPDIVTGLSLMLLFSAVSIRAGFVTLLIAHIVFCIPYVILSVFPKLKQMDSNLVEASMDLGAKPFYTLRKIVFPEIKSGIVTGALLAFTLSIDDFVISFFTTGSGGTNLSIYIIPLRNGESAPKSTHCRRL
jgi:ABC-type spermidine/putrescine transport system permease subunit II